MEVKSYECEKNSMMFVVMPATSNPDDLPDQIKEVTGKISLFKEFNLVANSSIIGLNTQDALNDIDTKGYHLSKSKIVVNEMNA